jgi:nucleotide-binding universal stress UspA family protein
MITIKRVLCPTDLSTEADEALRYGVALTAGYGAKLFLLYCKEAKGNGDHGRISPEEAIPLFTDSLGPHLGLNDLSNLDWEGLVACNVSDVGKTIVSEAKKHEIDLIVMRSRRREYAAALLGSTAETVSRSAPCPVLVTHPSEREWVGLSTGEIDLRRVLVAHDFSKDSELALNYGVSLAQEYQAEIHVLHALRSAGRDEPELAWSSGGSPYSFAAQRLQRAISKEVYLWCNVVNVMRYGGVYQEVLTYAKEHEIDLICMGARGRDRSLGKLFGSNVDRVLRQAPCPVLVARSITRDDAKNRQAGGNGWKHRRTDL